MTRLLAFVGILGLSFSAIFVRFAAVSPTTAGFFRVLFALPVLLVLTRFTGNDPRPRSSRWMTLGCGIMLAFDMIFFHKTIGLLGAGLATVMGNTQVLFVGIAGWVIHRERPRFISFIMVPVVFIGVVLVTGLGRAGAYGAYPVLGVLVGLISGMLHAAFIVILRMANQEDVHPAVPLMEATAGAVVVTLIYGSVFESDFSLVLSGEEYLWLGALAVVCHITAWILISFSLPELPALDTGVSLLMQPMLTVIWGWILFQEYLSIIQITGVAIILVGITLLNMTGAASFESGDP